MIRTAVIAAFAAGALARPFAAEDVVYETATAVETAEATEVVTVTAGDAPSTTASSTSYPQHYGHHSHDWSSWSSSWSSAWTSTWTSSSSSEESTSITTSSSEVSTPSTTPSSTPSTTPSTSSTPSTTSTQAPKTTPSSSSSHVSVPSITSSAVASVTSAAGSLSPTLPYASGVLSVTDSTGSVMVFSYSAPTQSKWSPPTTSSSPAPTFNSEALNTQYTLTKTNSGGGTYTTVTATSEAACSAAPSDYVKTVLDLHNQHRENHTANPLIWDDTLACVAQRQADTCIFEHLTYIDDGGYGQNLAGGDETVVGGIASWYNEAPSYADFYGQQNPGGNFENYGHFTQMVWGYSTSIGCATLDCGNGPSGVDSPATGNYTVCNYFGVGNMGDFYGVYVKPAGNMAPVSES